MSDSMKEEVARTLLDINAVTLRTDPPFKFVSGILSPIYTDNRLLMSYPEARKNISKFLIETMESKGLQADYVAGVASSGIPWASWVAEKLGKPMIYVRPAKKVHGKENLVEGKLEEGKKVLIIEDLISTGGSSVSAVNSVRSSGGVVTDCLAIFTYEFEKARNNFKEAECNLVNLTDFTTLVSVARENGYISADQEKHILEWNKDPSNWGR